MASTTPSFALALSAPPSAPKLLAIPTGSWTVYFHEPEDPSWTADSYKNIAVCSTVQGLSVILHELGNERITGGLLRIMRGSSSPLWENKANIHGGSYCLKIPGTMAIDVFKRYLNAAILGLCAVDTENQIVGVTISPKSSTCIIKIWNLNAKIFHSAKDIPLLHPAVKEAEILYRPHTEQRM